VTLRAECQTLQEVPMFRNIEPAKLKLLAFAAERVHCERGEIVFAKGDAADAVYILVDGEVDVFHDSVRLERLRCGSIIGELGVLCCRPRTHTVEAATECCLLKIERNVFFDLLEQIPQLAVALSRELGQRLDKMNETFVSRLAGLSAGESGVLAA
jgi:CRP/FNR family cyclic AMP-dependent transcriptional regulator